MLFDFVTAGQQIGPSSEYLGALSITELGHGMKLYVNYTQYPDRLDYSAWFYNPNGYAYWNDAETCLVFIVGMPPVAETKNKECTFLTPQQQQQQPSCLVEDAKGVTVVDNCGNQAFILEPQYIRFDVKKYDCGLHQVYAASYMGVTINPNEEHNIAFQSVYTKIGSSKTKEQCNNFQLGNGTLFDFQYFERDSSGHYLITTTNFGKSQQEDITFCLFLIIAVVVVCLLI